jgi:hypothetical protein
MAHQSPTDFQLIQEILNLANKTLKLLDLYYESNNYMHNEFLFLQILSENLLQNISNNLLQMTLERAKKLYNILSKAYIEKMLNLPNKQNLQDLIDQQKILDLAQNELVNTHKINESHLKEQLAFSKSSAKQVTLGELEQKNINNTPKQNEPNQENKEIINQARTRVLETTNLKQKKRVVIRKKKKSKKYNPYKKLCKNGSLCYSSNCINNHGEKCKYLGKCRSATTSLNAFSPGLIINFIMDM